MEVHNKAGAQGEEHTSSVKVSAVPVVIAIPEAVSSSVIAVIVPPWTISVTIRLIAVP